MEVLRKIYDVIVLGDNISGLITASLMEKRGANVLVICPNDDDRTFNLEGYSFSNEPTILACFEKGNFFEKIFKEICYDWSYEKAQESISHQIVLPEARVDLFPNHQYLLREVEREFPENSHMLGKLYSHFNEVSKLSSEFLHDTDTQIEKSYISNFLVNRKIAKKEKIKEAITSDYTGYMNQAFTNISPELKAFFLSQIKTLSYEDFSNPDMLTSSWLLSTNFRKYNTDIAHVHELQDFLKKRFLKFKGDIEDISQFEYFVTKGSNIKTAILKKGIKEYYCRYLIINTQLRHILKYFPKGFKAKRLANLVTTEKFKGMWYTVNFIVDRSVIPIGMKNKIIYLSNLEKSMNLGEYLIVSLEELKDENIAEKQILLSASIFIDLGKPEHFEDYYEYTKIIHKKVNKLIPFFDDYLIYSYPSTDNPHAYKTDLFESYLNFLRRGDYNYVYQEDTNINPIIGSQFSCPYKNMFISGRNSYKHLGVSGEIFAGYKLANHLTKKIKF